MREIRFAKTRIEVRAASGDGGGLGTITGHGAVFNTPSQALWDAWEGAFVEVVLPGAFDDAVAQCDVRALFNHDPNLILGRTSANTLQLEVDSTGLGYEIDAPDTSAGRDLVVSAGRGDVKESSFSFQVPPEGDSWTWDLSSNLPMRSISTVMPLYDVSPVTFPAYPAADAGLRAALSNLAEQRSMPLDELMGMAKRGEMPRVLRRSDVHKPNPARVYARQHRLTIPA